MNASEVGRTALLVILTIIALGARALPIILLSLSLGGCVGGGEVDDRRAPPDALQLATTTAEASSSSGFIELSGVLEPERRVALASKLPGRVKALSAEEGERVAANATLVQLDARDLQARRAQLVASRSAATAQSSWTEREMKRSVALSEGGALSGAQLDEMQRGRDVAEASLSGVNAQLLELDLNLADASIRAPFAGVIVRRTVELGQLAAPGQPLLVLEDDATLRVSVFVSAAEAAALTAGQRVTLRADGALTREGTVRAIVSSGDPGTPGLRAIVSLDNADHTWRAGAIAQVSLPSPAKTDTMVEVPTSAVQYRGSLPGVWVVRDDRLVFAWIRIASATDATTQVSAGVQLGDHVVRDGRNPSLRDGLRAEATR